MKPSHPIDPTRPRCQHGCGNRYRLRTMPLGQTSAHQCVLATGHDDKDCQFEREDAVTITPSTLRALLKREADGHRRIAFPTGADRKHVDGSRQRQLLVARGGYFACKDLIEQLTPSKEPQP